MQVKSNVPQDCRNPQPPRRYFGLILYAPLTYRLFQFTLLDALSIKTKKIGHNSKRGYNQNKY